MYEYQFSHCCICEAFPSQCVLEWCFDFCLLVPRIALFVWCSIPDPFWPWAVRLFGWLISDSDLLHCLQRVTTITQQKHNNGPLVTATKLTSYIVTDLRLKNPSLLLGCLAAVTDRCLIRHDVKPKASFNSVHFEQHSRIQQSVTSACCVTKP